MLVIPNDLKKRMKGIVRPVMLNTFPECGWSVHIEHDKNNDKLVFNKGWLCFADGHELQVDDILVFKVIEDSTFKVDIYDHNTSTKILIICDVVSSNKLKFSIDRSTTDDDL